MHMPKNLGNLESEIAKALVLTLTAFAQFL